MNNIVLDLEWNQNPKGKEDFNDNLLFEVIEIGAIKLNNENKVIDQFHSYICPIVYNEFHPKTKELLHLDMSVLENEKKFPEVINSFFKWCGQDYSFCTWGMMDIWELRNNMRYHNVEQWLKGPVVYYDVQKLFALQYEGIKNPKTLEYAVDYLGIKKKRAFHSAIHDAMYTAQIFECINNHTKQYISFDCYYPPMTKEEEIKIKYDNYKKHITRSYTCKEDLLQDFSVKSVECFYCNKRIHKKIKWFSINSKNYICLAYCRDHGYIKGRIQIKKTGFGSIYANKIIKPISKEEAIEIGQKKTELQMKKRNRKEQEEK